MKGTDMKCVLDAAITVGLGAAALGVFTAFVVVCACVGGKHRPERHVEHHPFTIIETPYDWAEMESL
jgi:hypothetical protein